MQSPDIGIDGIDIAMSDRWMISAALGLLRNEIKDVMPGSPLFARISELRNVFAVGDIRKVAPPHLLVDDAEFLNLMATLPVADTWLLRWERDERYDNFALIAEIGSGDRVLQFDLASNLLGTGAFQQLKAAEAAFVAGVGDRIRAEAPAGAVEFCREIVEIPAPWSVAADGDKLPSDLEEYLSDITAKNRLLDYHVRATLVDVHSNSDLASAEFAGVWAEVFATRDDLDSLRPTIDGVAKNVIENPSRILA